MLVRSLTRRLKKSGPSSGISMHCLVGIRWSRRVGSRAIDPPTRLVAFATFSLPKPARRSASNSWPCRMSNTSAPIRFSNHRCRSETTSPRSGSAGSRPRARHMASGNRGSTTPPGEEESACTIWSRASTKTASLRLQPPDEIDHHRTIVDPRRLLVLRDSGGSSQHCLHLCRRSRLEGRGLSRK